MKEISVSGQKRTETGKKASKLIRKEGLIPCNLYGEKRGDNNLPEAMAFVAPFTELRKAVYTPHVYVVNLNIDGKEHKAIIKELQFHPTSDALIHADFYEINENKAITVGIPVNLTGHAQGVRDGGKLQLQIRKINVTAPYKNIPEKLDIDVTSLELGKSIKVGSLSFDGLEIATPKEVIVCSVKATRASRSAAAAEDAQ
ncbi:MAG: 50S ribosomal protein L25/general stress protein Ctc [Prevotella sp.]|jgi:large subunit ribosomal protein L25|nr:50S ribosomal protein L25/general stress protein Ctc [Prevotella sp.]MBQ5407856.1 50S ribosomal protein L25/general stress protein Ctc [Prevotella sp.]